MEVVVKLAGKTALITGGNSGIGLATAKLFVAEGARVAIVGRNPATLDEAARSLGAKALAVRADAAKEGEMDRAVAEIVSRFDALDIVFANAGIADQTPLGATQAEAFEHVLSANLTGVFLTVQAAAGHLKPGASVILTGSVHGVLGMPGFAAYAASKAGLKAMSKVFASELAPKGVRVNIVTPGATRTPIWARQAGGPAGDVDAAVAAVEARVARSTPLGRLSDPQEIAKAALYFASSDSANVTAAEIVVDGGMIGAPAGAPFLRPAA
jgi:NAD(P)-dependent dehydrogenase (short-subunit alcohol dehydrogenase family)